MKIMIRNSQSVYIKLIFLSSLLLPGLLNCLYARSPAGELIYKNPEIEKSLNGIAVYNRNNEIIFLNDTSSYFIVIKNNRFCSECFRSMNDYVSLLRKEVSAKFIVINLSDSTVLARKRLIAADKDLMPDFDDYYFQYNNENTNTIFDSLKTEYTPELLIIRNGEITHIPNNEIFDSSLNIKLQIQDEIIEKLK